MPAFKLLIEAFRDFLWPISPSWLFQRDRSEPAFAFIVHPRSISDVYHKYLFTRVISPKLLEWFLLHFWPVILSEVEGLRSVKNGKPIRGWILSIPLTAEQVISKRKIAVKMIKRAIKLAYCRGANVVGLGALNASVTYRGRDIEDIASRLDIGITSGVGYTSFNVADLISYLIKHFKLDNNVVVGVVGAAGGIASAVIRFLFTKGIKNWILIDLDRKHNRVHELIKEFKIINPSGSFRVTSQLSELKQCRFIITATNAPEALIRSEHLSTGTIILDDAQPSDVDAQVVLEREDILVISAGIIEAKEINTNFDLDLKHRNDVYSCLAEVMVLAAHHRIREKSFDYASVDEIQEIGKLGKALGFGRAEFQNFNKVYTGQDLNNFYDKYIKKI